MSDYLVRTLVTLVLAIMLGLQIRSSGTRIIRRYAMILATVAAFLFALYNALPGLNLEGTTVATAVLYTGLALLLTAGVLLVVSVFRGELRGKRAEFDSQMRAFGSQREQEREKRK